MSTDQLRAKLPHASADTIARNPHLFSAATKAPDVDLSHDPHDVTGSKHAVKPMIRQDRRGLNKWEEAFREHLASAYGSSATIHREGLGIRIGNGCIYWPDFVVSGYGYSIRCYEVKGYMRDDAAVKLKVAASKFPTFSFFLVTKQSKKAGGGWDIQEVLP